MLEIPPDSLAPATLTALIEEFVTRHGADLTDASDKIAQVRRHLAAGRAVILWDEEEQSCTIVEKIPPPKRA